MRFLYCPSAAERAEVRARLARMQQPAALLEVLAPILPVDFRPAGAFCRPCSVHADGFVMRAHVWSSTGDERDYALKGYADDFGERVWAYARALAPHFAGRRDAPCLPIHHLPRERMLVFPWIEGRNLADGIDNSEPALLRRLARLAARWHRLPVVPEAPTTPDVLLEETRQRCRQAAKRWPDASAILASLLADLEQASLSLDPSEPAPVHGDFDAGQTLWTGSGLVVLDLDMLGYTDPAYDVGHFLAQAERRGAAPWWLAAFLHAYLAAAPGVSPRNVAFYRALTLIRKIHTVRRRQPTGWESLVSRIAARARVALLEAVAPAHTA